MEATLEKEGQYLLGEPTYRELENGRFKCVETGHELPAQNKESYARTKHCRLGLIDAALAANKPPLNMFLQDPASRSKLSCKLTGDTVNKSEEHIWKHINGRRFLNMLEKKETEKKQTPSASAMVVEKSPKKPEKKSKLKVKKEKHKKKKEEEEENGVEMQISSEKEESEATDIEEGFWMPEVGERWDFDNGADRWGSGSESDEQEETEDGENENETDDDDDDDANAEENNKEDTMEISKRTKRMCIEIDPSNLASAAKKKKKAG